MGNVVPISSVLPKEINTKEDVSPVLAGAQAFKIKSREDVEEANGRVRGISALMDMVEKKLGALKEKTHGAWKEACTQYNEHMDPLKEAKKLYQTNMGAFLLEEENKRKAEEAKAAEAARKEQEKILEKAAKKIDDLQAKHSDVASQIEALNAELYKPETTDAEAQAIRARLEVLNKKQASINTSIEEKVAEVEQAYTVTPAPPATAPAKVAGLGFRTKKVGEVINKMAVIKAVAAGNLTLDLLDVNMTIANKLINANMNIPGFKVTTQPIVSTRK